MMHGGLLLAGGGGGLDPVIWTGLRAWYPFSLTGNATDQSGNGRDLTLYGSPAIDSTWGLYCDSAGKYAAVTLAAGQSFYTDAEGDAGGVTWLCVWKGLSTATNGSHNLVMATWAAYGDTYYLGGLRCYGPDGGANKYAYLYSTIQNQGEAAWNAGALSWGNPFLHAGSYRYTAPSTKRHHVWANGSDRNNVASNGFIWNQSCNRLVIGNGSHGWIDEVRVYCPALSDAEILSIGNSIKARYGITW